MNRLGITTRDGAKHFGKRFGVAGGRCNSALPVPAHSRNRLSDSSPLAAIVVAVG